MKIYERFYAYRYEYTCRTKKEIHVKGSKKQQGSSIIVTASTTFLHKSEYDLENCFSAIKNYVDCFNKQAENSFPNIKTFE